MEEGRVEGKHETNTETAQRLRRWDFLPNVFHLQFNLPSSSFLLPMSVFVATGL
jgi:hypothetical protein